MKNLKTLLLGLTLLMALSVPKISSGQIQSYSLYTVNHAGVIGATDTLTNTDTGYLVLALNNHTSISPFQYPCDVVYTWTNTSITGTVSGNVIAQGSETGVIPRVGQGDWQTLINDKTGSLIIDTITLSGTTSGVFIIPNVKYKFVRLRLLAGGTATTAPTGKVYIKPHN